VSIQRTFSFSFGLSNQQNLDLGEGSCELGLIRTLDMVYSPFEVAQHPPWGAFVYVGAAPDIFRERHRLFAESSEGEVLKERLYRIINNTNRECFCF